LGHVQYVSRQLSLFSLSLDHVFHSNDFTLIDLCRLGFVGSDHFSICMALSHTPEAAPEQPEPEQKPE
jgi:endonuclease/exonuclease/phosphatase (EEP) superfamily protein YafD